MEHKDEVLESAVNGLKRNWGWLFVFGLLLELMGMAGIVMAVAMTIASMYVFAAFMAVAGVLQLIDAFRDKHWKGMLWHLVIGILYLIGAAVIFYDPILASTLFTAILAYLLIFIGVSRMVLALSIRQQQGWFWLLIAGIAAIVLGVLILMHWPMSGLWVIGLMISIELMINGWAYMLLALGIRRA